MIGRRAALVAFVAGAWSIGLAASPSLSFSVLLSALDPAMDPAVAHFTREENRPQPTPSDLIRWSARANVEVAPASVPSGSLTARLSGPIDAGSALAEERERYEVELQLARLRKTELERAYVFGVLDLVCRWGYLAAAAPLLDLAAEAAPAESARWRVRALGARLERDALLDQIHAHAPAVSGLLNDAEGFLCRWPALGPLDGPLDLDDHPSLAAFLLEVRQSEHYASFATGIGVPEWSLDGSVRYGAGPEPWAADLRLSLRVPIRLAGATASTEWSVDGHGMSGSVRIANEPYLPDPDAPEDARAWLRERAALELRLASTRAGLAALELAWAEHVEDTADRSWDALSTCLGLCPVPQVAEPHSVHVAAWLDTLTIGAELARTRLEELQVAAASPDALARAIHQASGRVDQAANPVAR